MLNRATPPERSLHPRVVSFTFRHSNTNKLVSFAERPRPENVDDWESANVLF